MCSFSGFPKKRTCSCFYLLFQQPEMFQRIPDAVLIHIGGNVIRRGTGVWPGVAHGNPDPGKSKHLGIVAAIAKGDAAKAAEAAGAMMVGDADLVAKIQNEGFIDFDVLVTTPDMMGLVGRLGKVLGPRGLMPNPKAGTVTPDVGRAVTEAKAGKIEYRLDKANIIHVPIGKASFGAEKLGQNLSVVMEAIVKAKPAAAKGQYIKSATVASTMGPGIKLNSAKFGG